MILQTLKLAKHMRQNGRQIIQPGLKSAISNMLSELEDFFSVMKCDMTSCKGKSFAIENRSVVMCTSVEGLIEYVKARRNAGEIICKIGIDGGQGSLKIIMTIEEGMSTTGLKDSGVRKCFILALAPGIQENYKNISLLWLRLGLHKIKAIVTGEIKIYFVPLSLFNFFLFQVISRLSIFWLE